MESPDYKSVIGFLMRPCVRALEPTLEILEYDVKGEVALRYRFLIGHYDSRTHIFDRALWPLKNYFRI